MFFLFSFNNLGFSLAVDVLDTASTAATLAAIGVVVAGGAAASTMSVSTMSPNSAPSGVPQPGTGNTSIFIVVAIFH